MFDFLMGNEQYPIKADYLELIPPENKDDEKTYMGAVVFQYRVVSKSHYSEQAIIGLKGSAKGIVIKTKDSLPFKQGDLVMLRDKTYKIDRADKVDNTLYEKSRIIYNHFNDYETEIILV